MDVLIVGAGAMGNWFADVLGGTATISFTDIAPDRAAEAARRHDTRTLPPESDETFDVVCLAVPISIVASAVDSYGPQARRAMVDLSGQMAGPVEAMRRTVPNLERISLHPLFAPENAPGNVPAVIENEGPIAAELREVLQAGGYEVIETTVQEHDRAMETIQAKAHAALFAYALAAEPVPEGFETPISAGLEELLDDLLGGTPRVYAEIQAEFPGAEEVADAARRVARADREKFESLYGEATTRYEDRSNDER